MDAMFFHPKLVHVPLALAVLMPLVAAVVLAAWWRGWLPARAWALVAMLQAALVVGGVASLRSGEAEEHRVEQVVPGRLIHEHEEAAEVFVGAGGAVFGLMAVALVLSGSGFGLRLALTSVLGTVAVMGLGIRAGQLGGELVYKYGAASVYAGEGGGLGAQRGDEAPAADTDAEHD